MKGLAEALESIPERQAIAFAASVLYGASDELIADELEISPKRVRKLVSTAASVMRHPSRSQILSDYFDHDGQSLLIDAELRDLIRRWQLEERFASVCTQCGHRYSPAERTTGPPQRAGRPRKYCSNACRQKAYRDRRRGGPGTGEAGQGRAVDVTSTDPWR